MKIKPILQRIIAVGMAMSMTLSAKAQAVTEQEQPADRYDVGEISVRYALTPTGAATYNVPLDIHPDVEGFQPQLSFVYNSQQRESALGYGWTIGGLSAISHISGNIYHDGRTSPLSLNEDKWVLDGVRLIKQGTDEWQTEQGFVKVKKRADGSFTARYPDGNTARFESLPQAPFSYVMTQYTNRKARSLKYTYSQTDNLPYIRTILYGEVEGSYNDSIVFTYRPVNAPLTRYIDGKPFKYSQLLEKVESFHKGKLWRRYRFTYKEKEVNIPVRLDCETDKGRLAPLQFKTGGGRSIDYLSGNTILLERFYKNSTQGSGGYSSLALSRGKFSHSSKSDGLISYPALGKYNEAQSLFIYKDLSSLSVSPVVFMAGKGFKLLEAMDVDGDGLEEPVKVNYDEDRLTVSVYTNDVDPQRYSNYTYPEASGYVHERQFVSGDFNGDGKVELLAISSCYDRGKNKYPSRALMIDLQKRQAVYDGNCFDFTLYQYDERALFADRLIPMDYNGDGKTDIVLININGLYVYEFTGTGFKQLAYSNAINIMHFNFESSTIKDRELMVADMNGDGNMDIVMGPRRVHCKDGDKHLGDGICYHACENESFLKSTSASGYKTYVHPYSGQICITDPSVHLNDLLVTGWELPKGKEWTFLISTGNSSYQGGQSGFKLHQEELFYCFHETVGLNFMLVDIDGDGLPDLLRNVRGKVYVHFNKNGKISREHDIRSVIGISNRSAQFAVANVQQPYYWSGSLICVDNHNLHAYHYTYNESKDRMMHELTDSYGMTSSLRYIDISDTSDPMYTARPDYSLGYLSYPYATMSPHMYVPAWLEKLKDGKSMTRERYYYTNAVFHRQGLGFCGFRKIETENEKTKQKMVSVFDPYMRGAEVRKETLTNRMERTYSLKKQPNKTILLNVKEEIVKDLLNHTEKKTQYNYNSYGQPVHAETSYMSEHDYSESKHISYLNVENADSYLLGLPVRSEAKRKKKSSTTTQIEEVQYDSNLLPVLKTNLLNNEENRISQERYVYNERWQLIEKHRKNYQSPDSLSYLFEYDREGRLLKETDPMGRYTSYSYDPSTGLVKQVADSKRRTTRYVYDAWGRLIKTIHPDGHTKEVSTKWIGTGEPGTFVITTTETGKPTTKVYYDHLKREVRTSQIRFDGREMKIDKVYDEHTGLLCKESTPATDSVPSRWNIMNYDKYNRPTSTRYASGKIDSCAYGVLTDTIIENCIRRIRLYDAKGLMVRTTDHGGNIRYEYRLDGQLKCTTLSDSIRTHFHYDNYGRRTAIQDPSAGIRRTVYDEAGNICNETDADGREVMKEYDRYGRITKQITPDLTTVFTYDNEENLPVSAVSSNTTALYYTYDEFGRPKTKREEAPDGKWMQQTYAYSPDGLPVSIAYTSQNGELTTEHFIYRNGSLVEVRLADGTLVYRHDEENAMGQLTKLTTGSMQRYYTFTEWGMPAERSILRADGSTIFSHSYSFDHKKGNLMHRRDELRKKAESFKYDSLNRLLIFGKDMIQYDGIGNIIRKGNAGNLVYTNPNRPYAVTGLTPKPGLSIPTEIDITYNAGQRPSVICQNLKRADLLYNADYDRVRMQYKEGNSVLLTRYYLGGNYELDETLGSVKEKLYLGGGYYDAPAVLVKEDGRSSVLFIHRDYLGSILQIADASGHVIEENSFDAWGCRRNPSTHEVYAFGSEPRLLLGRGYTGHEHLSFFGIINMNARLYDPILGRFLSPDPYVQLPDNTQAFNRYSYCMNNPLCYVDENGEFWWIVAAGVVGGIINVVTNWDSIDNFGQGLAYFGVGAAAGTLAAVTGGAAVTAIGIGGAVGGAVGGIVGGAVSGFIIGAGNTAVAGGDGFSALSNGFQSGLYGSVIGGFSGFAIGGTMSLINGQNVWTGRDIAQGRSAFSMKNTPVSSVEHLRSTSVDKLPTIPPTDSSMPRVEPENQNALFHYTSEVGYNGIMETKQLLPSMGDVHARFGNGQYLTNLKPSDYTIGQVSARLYRVPWNTARLTHYIKIDVTGLDIIKNNPYNFLIRNNQPLNINNRIIESGVTVFKIKF